MNSGTHQSNIFTRYLLGDLPPSDSERLEERYFSDDEAFVDLLDAEDQLINDYLRDLLPATERERFERRFLSQPARREKVRFARRLMQAEMTVADNVVPTPQPTPLSWWKPLLDALTQPQLSFRFAGAAAVLLIAVYASQMINSRRQVSSVESPPPSASVGSLAQTPLPSASIVTVVLGSGAERGTRGPGESVTLQLSSVIQPVELKLKVEASTYASYQAQLRNVDEPEAALWHSDALKAETAAEGRVVVLKLRSDQLPSGDYHIELRGLSAEGQAEKLDTRPFSVRRPPAGK